MSNDLEWLTEDHVRQLGRIIEALDKSTFDYLQLDVGDLKVTLGKGGSAGPGAGAAASAAASPPREQVAQPAAASSPAPAAASQAAAAPAAAAAPPPAKSPDQGTVAIKSPIMGMFYAQPEPGAAPFVQVGSTVTEETTVALVEVMKTFNAVSAGVRGRIVEVCVQDAQLVEFGQVLFRVTPE